MHCKCGSEMKYGEHTVKSDAGKKNWMENPPAGVIAIQQWDCPACGRHMHEIFSEGKLVQRFG